MVGRACVDFLLGADEGAALDAGDIAFMRAGEVAARALFLVELDELALLDHHLADVVVLLLLAGHDHDAIGRADLVPLVDPRENLGVLELGGLDDFGGGGGLAGASLGAGLLGGCHLNLLLVLRVRRRPAAVAESSRTLKNTFIKSISEYAFKNNEITIWTFQPRGVKRIRGLEQQRRCVILFHLRTNRIFSSS